MHFRGIYYIITHKYDSIYAYTVHIIYLRHLCFTISKSMQINNKYALQYKKFPEKHIKVSFETREIRTEKRARSIHGKAQM